MVPFCAGPDGAQRATDGGIDRRILYGEKENNHKTAMKKMCMLALAAMVSALPVMAKGGEKAETEAQKAERMEWFAKAKFGVFIHWGI